MENKIVYLKTYIITILVLIILFIVGICGLIYYYENKINKIEDLKNTIQDEIKIVQDLDTNIDNVEAE